VLEYLKAMFTFGPLNKLVIFLIFGVQKVKVAHFLLLSFSPFFLGHVLLFCVEFGD
jgi:hypothetical protein